MSHYLIIAFSNHFPFSLFIRLLKHLKPGLVHGQWKPDEDAVILDMVAKGFKWADIATAVHGRTREQIRTRFVNVLDPCLIQTPWTDEEDKILFKYQHALGNKWTAIRKYLPGRSENSIKNRYYNRRKSVLTKEKKKRKSTGASLARTSPPVEVQSLTAV
jgi:hypothetical protein